MARWDGQVGALALGPCPGVPRAESSSGCQPGWDSHVSQGGMRLGEPWGSRTEGPRLCRRCGSCVTGGFTTGSCRTGTAPVGTARWHHGGTRTTDVYPDLPGGLWVLGRAVTMAEPDFAPAAGTVHPPGSSGCPSGCCSAGPAPQRRPRLGAWSWRCRARGWWRRGAGSRRRDLRSDGQTRGWKAWKVPTMLEQPFGHRGPRTPHPHPAPHACRS